MSAVEKTRQISEPFSVESIGDIPEVLQHYPTIHPQVVAWGDMDAFNHLNNVVYYRYAESARIAYLRAINMFAAGSVTVLAQCSCQYLVPVTYPDTLLIGVRSKSVGNSSIVTEYLYYSTAQKKVVATGEAVVVRLDDTAQRKSPWTAEERQQLLSFDQAVGHEPQTS
ncbi:acyl-CoA thioesterase [Psychrobacter sp. I-STPA6b]|uniref:acyl-CoA thioesterase n=1 Tax=Psychrobacter sp. I-STPA6b TaxID=2585718 RepID=UPI001D0C9431|nr:thioesterase family protein [Psychrobacter sp. I-STPA6b]